MAEGKRLRNGKDKVVIPEYDMASGSTEWIIPMTNTYKWLFFFQIENIVGTGGTLAVSASGDEGNSWTAYPNMVIEDVDSNKSISFDDSYTVYDQIKVAFTAGSITAGSITPNQRLYSNPVR